MSGPGGTGSLWTSESVTEGHPDKICDQISDAVLDACLKQDPHSRVACETAVCPQLLLLFGEITTCAEVNYEEIARGVLRRVGYTDPSFGIDADSCKVMVEIHEQSPDLCPVPDKGAGDQGMMFGFACDETEMLMPMPIALSHQLTRGLAELRCSGGSEWGWLRPDGKAQVTVEYANGYPLRIDTIVISAQHEESITHRQIEEALRDGLIGPQMPSELLDERTHYYINPSGRFVLGGPAADAGLTGRKIIVDTYGGLAHHGGGAFSGKDPSKVDRSAAYAARWAAKNVVAAGLASRAELQVSYAIGRAHPTSLRLDTFGTLAKGVSEETLEVAVRKMFDLRPRAIIEKLDLLRPVYEPTATYGHFGRSDLDLPWECTNRIEDLKSEAGLE